MTSSPGQRARIVAQSLVVFQAGIWSYRAVVLKPWPARTSGVAVKQFSLERKL